MFVTLSSKIVSQLPSLLEMILASSPWNADITPIVVEYTLRKILEGELRSEQRGVK
jgi:hypothetical protein